MVLPAADGRLTMDRFVDLLTLVSVIAPVVSLWVMFKSPRVTPEECGRPRPYIALFLASVGRPPPTPAPPPSAPSPSPRASS